MVFCSDLPHTGDEAVLVTSFGRPFTADGCDNKLTERGDSAGAQPSVAAHGISNSVGINMAENAAAPYEFMAAPGHSSPNVTKVYTEAADRHKLSPQASANTPS